MLLAASAIPEPLSSLPNLISFRECAVRKGEKKRFLDEGPFLKPLF